MNTDKIKLVLTPAQLLIAVAAGIGGIAPNIVNLAQSFTSNSPTVPPALYWVGMAIFFLLGAAVALIFCETAHSKAFFLGVSLPAFIAAAQSHHGNVPPVGTPKHAVETKQESGSIRWFLGVAHALEPELNQAVPTQNSDGDAPPGVIKIRPVKPCKDCEVWFYSPKGDPLGKSYFPSLEGETSFVVPQGATKFGIWNDKINPKLWTLPEKTVKYPKYEFNYDYNKWNDLKRGLGDYDARSYDSEVLIVPGRP